MRLTATLIVVLLMLFSNTNANAQSDLSRLPSLQHQFPLSHADVESLDQSQQQNIHCLALNVYFEARGTPVQDQIAVAWVTKNRSLSDHFEHSICASVFEINRVGHKLVHQFSWVGLHAHHRLESVSWIQAQNVAYQVYNDQVSDPTHGALYFHDRDDFRGSWRQHHGKIHIGRHYFIG